MVASGSGSDRGLSNATPALPVAAPPALGETFFTLFGEVFGDPRCPEAFADGEMGPLVRGDARVVVRAAPRGEVRRAEAWEATAATSVAGVWAAASAAACAARTGEAGVAVRCVGCAEA